MCKTCSEQAGNIAAEITEVLNKYRNKGDLTYATVLGTFRILEDILLRELDEDYEEQREPNSGARDSENPRLFSLLRKHAEAGPSEDEGDRSRVTPEAP